MPRRDQETERTCIVTRAASPLDALIRFVVAPDGAVVPGFRRRLPGRGIWVTARAEHVATAERRRLFARAHGGPVKQDAGLADRVERGFAEAALSALSFARKAGLVVSGFAKVEAAIARDHVIGLIHAVEAAPDGVAKITACARRHGRASELVTIRDFSGAELDLAFGRANVVHAALLAGTAGDNLLARIDAWRAFRCDERDVGGLDGSSTAQELNTGLMSSGQRNE